MLKIQIFERGLPLNCVHLWVRSEQENNVDRNRRSSKEERKKRLSSQECEA